MTFTNRKNPRSSVKDKLHWAVRDQIFEDGSKVQDWDRIEGSPWVVQDDGYELSFDIYRHDGRFWKLYIARRSPRGRSEYDVTYGGVACRVAEVRYKIDAVSPHSRVLKKRGALEWVRVGEVDEDIHTVTRKGED